MEKIANANINLLIFFLLSASLAYFIANHSRYLCQESFPPNNLNGSGTNVDRKKENTYFLIEEMKPKGIFMPVKGEGGKNEQNNIRVCAGFFAEPWFGRL